MRRFLLAAILFALIGMTSVVADDPPVRVAPPDQPKLIPSGLPTTRITTPATLDEELRILEAQRDTKKAYLKVAEIGAKAAEMNFCRVHLMAERGDVTKDEIDNAKLEVETAQAHVAIRSGELKEVEVKIKHIGKRFAEAKAVAALKANGKVVEAGGLIIGMTGFGRIQILRGISEVQPSNTFVANKSKIAVFNMAKIMKDYRKAKYKVYELNEEKKKMSGDLVHLQAEYLKLQNDLKSGLVTANKEEIETRQREVTREIEDKDRQINKKLNEKATAIIGELYDEVKSVVDEIAETNGYDIVFAYPDATTDEELRNTYVKELKLKPPAAQPFYVLKHADLTEEILRGLNTRYPAPPVPQGSQQVVPIGRIPQAPPGLPLPSPPGAPIPNIIK